MKVTFENRLDVQLHLTIVRHGANEVTVLASPTRRLALFGKVLRYECLFPGTALALQGFDEHTQFTASIEGFTRPFEFIAGRDDADAESMLVIFRLQSHD